MRRFLIGFSLLLLSGCASAMQDGEASFPKLLALDLDAANQIAIAHNDTLGMMCYPALMAFLGTSTPSTDQIKGVVSAFEKARVTRMGLEGKSLVPLELRIACAPLLLDERDFLIRLGILGAGGALR